METAEEIIRPRPSHTSISECGSKVDRLIWSQDHAGSSPATLTKL